MRIFLSWLRLRRLRLQAWVYQRLAWLLSPDQEVNHLRLLLVALSLIVLFQAMLLILGSPSKP